MEKLRNYNKSLLKQKNYAWAKFYESEIEKHMIQIEYYDLVNNMISGGAEKEIIPEFVINELRDLYEKTKKQIECPICFKELKIKEDIKFSNCGHKFCEVCLSKIENCAICRKKIYRKS